MKISGSFDDTFSSTKCTMTLSFAAYRSANPQLSKYEKMILAGSRQTRNCIYLLRTIDSMIIILKFNRYQLATDTMEIEECIHDFHQFLIDDTDNMINTSNAAVGLPLLRCGSGQPAFAHATLPIST